MLVLVAFSAVSWFAHAGSPSLGCPGVSTVSNHRTAALASSHSCLFLLLISSNVFKLERCNTVSSHSSSPHPSGASKSPTATTTTTTDRNGAVGSLLDEDRT